jgi:hypothetical protein
VQPPGTLGSRSRWTIILALCLLSSACPWVSARRSRRHGTRGHLRGRALTLRRPRSRCDARPSGPIVRPTTTRVDSPSDSSASRSANDRSSHASRPSFRRSATHLMPRTMRCFVSEVDSLTRQGRALSSGLHQPSGASVPTVLCWRHDHQASHGQVAQKARRSCSSTSGATSNSSRRSR